MVIFISMTLTICNVMHRKRGIQFLAMIPITISAVFRQIIATLLNAHRVISTRKVQNRLLATDGIALMRIRIDAVILMLNAQGISVLQDTI
jgi:hypothetical protein